MKTLVRHVLFVLFMAVVTAWAFRPARAASTSVEAPTSAPGAAAPAPGQTVHTRTVTTTTVTKVEKAPAETEEKSAFRKRTEVELDRLKNQIDSLEKKADSATGSARRDYDHAIQNLRAKRDEISRNLNEAGDKSGRAWEKFRSGLERSVNELKGAFKDANAEMDKKTADSTEAAGKKKDTKE